MREILSEVRRHCAAGRRLALATVVEVRGSAPRGVGAALAVTGDGAVIGSLSGGCLEGAAYELCRDVLACGRPAVAEYGIEDELTCGGSVRVLAVVVDSSWSADLDALAAGGPAALAIGLDGTHAVVRDPGPARLEHGVFYEPFAPPARLIAFGAIDVAAALARLGGALGFRTTVCDARPVFATAERFPDADEVVADWPHRYLRRTPVDHRTAICVLTHDAKFDVPLLEVALRGPAGYVGAMGSRDTHLDRLARLRAAGLTEPELARLHAPIGLDIQAASPAEVAVAVLAEIIAARAGGTGRPLAGLAGPIHGRTA